MDPLMQLTGYVVLYTENDGSSDWFILDNNVFPSQAAARCAQSDLFNDKPRARTKINAVNVWVQKPGIVAPPTG